MNQSILSLLFFISLDFLIYMLIFYYIDNIYVQNCIDCTRVEYNVLTEEALLLKKRYFRNIII